MGRWALEGPASFGRWPFARLDQINGSESPIDWKVVTEFGVPRPDELATEGPGMAKTMPSRLTLPGSECCAAPDEGDGGGRSGTALGPRPRVCR